MPRSYNYYVRYQGERKDNHNVVRGDDIKFSSTHQHGATPSTRKDKQAKESYEIELHNQGLTANDVKNLKRKIRSAH